MIVKKEQYIKSTCLRNKAFLGYIFIILLQCGCITAGTHGSIKAYEYPVSKQKLQLAVEKVIASGGSIRRDTTMNFIVDVTNGNRDTIIDNMYNDTINYVTLFILEKGGSNIYTIQYYGDSTYWDTATTSEISLAYAWNKKRQGGSEGHGDVSRYNPALRNSLLKVFEREFISKVDSMLGVKHVEE